MPAEFNGDGFTNKEILVALSKTVNEGFTEVKQLIKDTREEQQEDHRDHENRLRSLERFRWAFPSIALVAALATVGLFIFTAIQGGATTLTGP